MNWCGRQVTHVCIVYTSKGIPVHSSLPLPVQLQYLILCSANSMSNLLKFIVSGHRVLLPWHDNMAICTHWSVFTVITYNAVTITKHADIEIHKTELKSQFINFINIQIKLIKLSYEHYCMNYEKYEVLLSINIIYLTITGPTFNLYNSCASNTTRHRCDEHIYFILNVQ